MDSVFTEIAEGISDVLLGATIKNSVENIERAMRFLAMVMVDHR